MQELLQKAGSFSQWAEPNVLVPNGDDGAVRLIGRGVDSVVCSTDTIRPVTRDPVAFGWIAAMHAAADIDAMGGTLIDALPTLGWSRAGSIDEGAAILRGTIKALRMEYGVSIQGGHTIHSDEPFLGFAVTGVVDSSRLMRITNGRPGDDLVLAVKPIGTGIIIRDVLELGENAVGERTARDAIMHMEVPIRLAAQVAIEEGAKAATDVTGSGLIGTLGKLARASGCSAVLRAGSVPYVHGVLDLFDNSITSAGKRNLDESRAFTDWNEPVTPKAYQGLFTDPQTSGPLLIATRNGEGLVEALDLAEIAADVIGKLGDGEPGHIQVDSIGLAS